MFDGKSKIGVDNGVLATGEDPSCIKGEKEFSLEGASLMGS